MPGGPQAEIIGDILEDKEIVESSKSIKWEFDFRTPEKPKPTVEPASQALNSSSDESIDL
jgi:hypothetical protein